MSFIFSRALVEAFSPGSCSETEPSAPSSATPTPQAFSSDDKTTDTYRRSRSGMTCGPLTEDLGEALLTAFLAASRARTSASRVRAPDLTAIGRGFGASLPAWFAKWNQQLCEWRTPQCSLLEGSELFSETWPRSGLMLDGTCYPQPSLGRINCASASGLLPTLCARDYRYPGKSRMERTGGKQGEVLPQIVGGPLNPDWCEWFMGFPIGWTASEVLETPRFHEWRRQHGVC
jgi:hypothetical protein